MRFLILALVIFSSYGAEAPKQDSKLPNDVVGLLNTYDKDMAKIQADADAASAARTEKLRPLLVKAQEAATKKGDLDTAMAIKAKIEKLIKPVEIVVEEKSPILLATWGNGDDTDPDVTEMVKNMKEPVKITVSLMGSDPAPNVKKYLTITKMVKGRKTKIQIAENTVFDPAK